MPCPISHPTPIYKVVDNFLFVLGDFAKIVTVPGSMESDRESDRESEMESDGKSCLYVDAQFSCQTENQMSFRFA
jgi:hypothetical protein